MVKIPKRIKRLAISAGLLFVAILVLGLIYTYYSDSSQLKTGSKTIAANLYQPIKAPPKPPANADVGIALEAFDNPVAPGGGTSMIISTTAGATCTLSVTYNGVKSTDPSLGSHTADAFGNVTWSWVVPPKTPYGQWPVQATCRLGQKWAVYDDSLVVKD